MAPEAHLVTVLKIKYPVILLYIQRVMEQLRKVFRSFGISANFKLTNIQGQILVHPNDKVEKGKVVGPVYDILCDDCDATYVYETD